MHLQGTFHDLGVDAMDNIEINLSYIIFFLCKETNKKPLYKEGASPIPKRL